MCFTEYGLADVLLFCHSLEVGSCIAVQVCMIQIPLLVLFNAVYVSLQKCVCSSSLVVL